MKFFNCVKLVRDAALVQLVGIISDYICFKMLRNSSISEDVVGKKTWNG